MTLGGQMVDFDTPFKIGAKKGPPGRERPLFFTVRRAGKYRAAPHDVAPHGVAPDYARCGVFSQSASR